MAQSKPMFVRRISSAGLHHCGILLCAFSLAACSNETEEEAPCPHIDELSAAPMIIDPGENAARISVRVSSRKTGDSARILTRLLSEQGVFEDESATDTFFSCDPAAEGPVEICVEARFEDADAAAGALDAAPASALPYGRKTGDAAACVDRACIEVHCPENLCPVIERFQLEETPVLSEATVFVEVSDPDGKPTQVTTTLSASSGSFDDVHASEATYTCEPFAPNPIEICVIASDGNAECDQRKCGEIDCNLCPFLYSLSVIPNDIPAGTSRAQVQVRAEDVDDFPAPLVTRLTASSGSFDDPQASDTFYVCDAPGLIELCVEASDEDCTKTECTQLTCP